MRVRGVALGVGLVVLAVACGGSSYKGLSKSDYVAQASAICNKYTVQGKAAFKALGSSPTEQQVIDFVKSKEVPAYNQELVELRKLKPPQADRNTVNTILDDEQAATNDAGTNTKQFVDHGSTAVTKKADAEAIAYGLKDCVAGSTT